MPEKRIIKYEMSIFPTLQTIYSESEMAAALGISVRALRARIRQGKYCYHCTRRDQSGVLRYEFQPEAYRDNLTKRNEKL